MASTSLHASPDRARPKPSLVRPMPTRPWPAPTPAWPAPASSAAAATPARCSRNCCWGTPSLEAGRGELRDACRRAGAAAPAAGTRRPRVLFARPRSAGVDVAFVCAPHGARRRRRRLLDVALGSSTSPPTSASRPAYHEWYGEHRAPSCCPPSTASPSSTATRSREKLVANPGCYPTAALLALAPLEGLGSPTS